MLTAEECLARAQALEALVSDQDEDWRRNGYLEMAALWRASARLKVAAQTDERPEATSYDPDRDRIRRRA